MLHVGFRTQHKTRSIGTGTPLINIVITHRQSRARILLEMPQGGQICKLRTAAATQLDEHRVWLLRSEGLSNWRKGNAFTDGQIGPSKTSLASTGGSTRRNLVRGQAIIPRVSHMVTLLRVRKLLTANVS